MILPPTDPNLDQQLSDPPPLRDDANFASGKIAIFQYGSVVIFLLLIAGFWRLQVQNPQIYDERAQSNSIKSVPIIAPRGRILDRDGRVIVDNHSSYTLLLARESMKEEDLRPIAEGLDLDYDDLMARVRRYRSRPKYEPIVLKGELTEADLAFVESHRDFFPELVLIHSQPRLYPGNGMMAHVIGYTGEISEQELDMPEYAKYDPGQVIGKFGIERQYNDWLTGVDGQQPECWWIMPGRFAKCSPTSPLFQARTCSSPSTWTCRPWRNSPWIADSPNWASTTRTARWWRWIRELAKCWPW